VPLTIDGKTELVADVAEELINQFRAFLRYQKDAAEVEGEDEDLTALRRQVLQLKLDNERLRLERENAKLEAEKLEALARSHRARSQIPRNDKNLRVSGKPPERRIEIDKPA